MIVPIGALIGGGLIVIGLILGYFKKLPDDNVIEQLIEEEAEVLLHLPAHSLHLGAQTAPAPAMTPAEAAQ